MRRVFGGQKPADLSPRIGESGLDGMKAIKQDALIIRFPPGPVPLPVAPIAALRLVRPYSVAPHGLFVSFAG